LVLVVGCLSGRWELEERMDGRCTFARKNCDMEADIFLVVSRLVLWPLRGKRMVIYRANGRCCMVLMMSYMLPGIGHARL
jgi:hypothetical protein